MEMPEIQYQAPKVSQNFAPVETVDSRELVRENDARILEGMNQHLQQMKTNAAIQVENAKKAALPAAELAQFSKTLMSYAQDQHEREKKDIEAEMTMLAFTDGFSPDPSFNAQEKELETQGKSIERSADAYELKTNDTEGAERLRGMSGWRKYYYMKAKTEQAAAGFGSWMSANADNTDFAVNGFTLASAPDAPTRQAVAAKMATSYMGPYSGMNKSFLGKYMFPGMQQGMTSTISTYAAENARRIKENRLDAASQDFLMSTDKATSMQNFRAELTAMGYTEADIRGKMIDVAGQFSSRSQLDAFLDAPYGPNGKSFREQYPQDAQEAINSFNTLKSSQATNNAKTREIADLNAKEAAMTAVLEDRKDGSFDANPERLQELADQARNNGYEETAKFWESQIGETAYMKNSDVVKKQYEAQMLAGVVPTKEEILQNPALKQEDKADLIKKIDNSGGSTENMDKYHKSIIEDSIRKRGKWTRDGANDPGVAAMEMKAMQEYMQVYNNEIQGGASPSVAANRALADFQAKFGDDPTKGAYRLYSAEDKDIKPNQLGKYAGYDATGALSSTVDPMRQVVAKLKDNPNRKQVIESEPELYEGESDVLKSLSESFATTGNIGTVPQVYYDMLQKTGGRGSILGMINTRLKANGLDPLPKELNDIIEPVESTFDEDTYKYISYKPNTVRTDIGMLNSGQEPIYTARVPNNIANDIEFRNEVTAVANRLGVNEADLYAVMSFETGGTFNPGIRNAAGSGATGLIQFMPSTARGLGTSTQALARMSRVQQMKYVEKYLSNKGVRGGSLSDLYMAVLFPAAVGKPDNYVLFGRGAMQGYTGVAYTQNKGLDTNGDGSVTKAEAAAKVLRHREPASSATTWRQPRNVRPELQ